MNWFGKRKTDLEKLFITIRPIYLRKNKRNDESLKRIDLLLTEKLREEGFEYQSKKQSEKKFSLPGRSFFLQLGLFSFVGILLFLVWEFSPAAYLPFIRIFSKPSTVDASLQGVSLTAAGVDKDLQAFSITLDKPVSEKFINETLKVSPYVAYEISLKDGNKTIVVTPKQQLVQGEVYSITLQEGTVFTDGSVLSQTEAWILPIKKVFSVNYISPSEDSGTYESSVEVYFSEEITRANFEKSFSMLPRVSGKIESITNNGFRFIPTYQFVPGTVYEVTINAELIATSGSLLQAEVKHLFIVSRDGANKEYDGEELSFESPYLNIGSNAQSTILFKGFIGAKQAVYEVTKAEALSVFSSIKKDKIVQWGKLIAGKKEKTTKDMILSRNILLDSLASGIYILRLQSQDRLDVQAFQVLFSSQLVYQDFLDANTGELHIWSDKKQGISAFGYKCADNCEIDKQVDISDAAYLSIQTNTQDFVLLQDQNGFVFFPAGIISTRVPVQENTVSNTFDVVVNYEKNSYRAGEVITMQTFLKKYTAEGPKLAGNEEIVISVCTIGMNEFCYQDVTAKTGENGVILHRIPTSNSQRSITIKILKSQNGIKSPLYQKEIILMKAGAPLITINTNKEEYEATEIIKVRGSILTVEGFPYGQDGIIVEQSRIKNEIVYDELSKTIRYYESNLTEELVRSPLKISAQGSYILDIPLQTIHSGWSAYTVRITIIMPDGEKVEKKILVTEKTLVLIESQQEGKVLNWVDISKPASIIIRVINKDTSEPVSLAIGSVTLNNTLNGVARVVQPRKDIQFTSVGKYVVDIKSFLAGEYSLVVDLPQLPTISEKLFTITTDNEGTGLSSKEAVVGEKLALYYQKASAGSRLVLYTQSSTYSTWQNMDNTKTSMDIQITDKMVGKTNFCILDVGGQQSSPSCDNLLVLREQRKYDITAIPVVSSDKKIVSIESQLQSLSGNDQTAIGYYTIKSASEREILKESTPIEINVSTKTVFDITEFSNVQDIVMRFFIMTKDGQVITKEKLINSSVGISFIQPKNGYNKNQTRIPVTFRNSSGSDFSGTAIITCSECTPTQSIISVRLSSHSQETYEVSIGKSLENVSVTLNLTDSNGTLIIKKISANPNNSFPSLYAHIIQEEYSTLLDTSHSKIHFSFSDVPAMPSSFRELSISPLLKALTLFENNTLGSNNIYEYQSLINEVDSESRQLANKQTIVNGTVLREWLLISHYIENNQSAKNSLERVKSYLYRVNLTSLSRKDQLLFLALRVELSQKMEYANALTILQEIAAKEPPFEELLLISEIYYSMGSSTQARDKLEQVIKFIPQQVPQRAFLSRIYLLSKQLQIPEEVRKVIKEKLMSIKVFTDNALVSSDIESLLLFNNSIDKSDYGSPNMQIKISVDDKDKVLQFTGSQSEGIFNELALGSKRIRIVIPAGRKIFVAISESE